MEHYCVRRARVGREHPSLAVHLLLVRVIKNGVFVHSGRKTSLIFSLSSLSASGVVNSGYGARTA